MRVWGLPRTRASLVGGVLCRIVGVGLLRVGVRNGSLHPVEVSLLMRLIPVLLLLLLLGEVRMMLVGDLAIGKRVRMAATSARVPMTSQSSHASLRTSQRTRQMSLSHRRRARRMRIIGPLSDRIRRRLKNHSSRRRARFSSARAFSRLTRRSRNVVVRVEITRELILRDI